MAELRGSTWREPRIGVLPCRDADRLERQQRFVDPGELLLVGSPRFEPLQSHEPDLRGAEFNGERCDVWRGGRIALHRLRRKVPRNQLRPIAWCIEWLGRRAGIRDRHRLRRQSDRVENVEQAFGSDKQPREEWHDPIRSADGLGHIDDSGAAPLYYIRIRTTSGGTAPIANSILGRNYVNASGSPPSGVIPVFDSAADQNNDGYLNDAEYARAPPGKMHGSCMRAESFIRTMARCDLSQIRQDVDVRNWVADYQLRFLNSNLLADGLFIDNSGGRSPLGAIQTIESSANYSEDYGSLLAAINTKIAPRWVAANTAGGGYDADAVIRNTPASVEEFALRPLASTYSQFEDEAALIAHRLSLQSPSAYLILDSLPTGGSTTDPRTQLATLAYYYFVADPNNTFLMFYGGDDPNSSWVNHWSPAATYDVGQPNGALSLFAQGNDPSNSALAYKIYQRDYGNALVLYKPLSYKPGVGTGTLSNATATTHQLNGTYRILNADGTLSGPVTSVTLRNGEGAILIKA